MPDSTRYRPGPRRSKGAHRRSDRKSEVLDVVARECPEPPAPPGRSFRQILLGSNAQRILATPCGKFACDWGSGPSLQMCRWFVYSAAKLNVQPRWATPGGESTPGWHLDTSRNRASAEGPGFLDEIRSLLSYTICGHLRMTAMKHRHYADVGHPQILDTPDSKIFINYGMWITVLAHSTSPRRVVAWIPSAIGEYRTPEMLKRGRLHVVAFSFTNGIHCSLEV